MRSNIYFFLRSNYFFEIHNKAIDHSVACQNPKYNIKIWIAFVKITKNIKSAPLAHHLRPIFGLVNNVKYLVFLIYLNINSDSTSSDTNLSVLSHTAGKPPHFPSSIHRTCPYDRSSVLKLLVTLVKTNNSTFGSIHTIKQTNQYLDIFTL